MARLKTLYFTLIFMLTISFMLTMSIMAFNVSAQGRNLGILHRPAPPLEVHEWRNLPEGKTSVDISDYKGKVVYLYFFQNW